MYEGANQTIRNSGGSVKVTIASNVGRGNGGTALACAGCWVVPRAANTGPVKMNIGAAAAAELGTEVPETTGRWVPINDVSKLYFWSGTNGDVIDITYIRG